MARYRNSQDLGIFIGAQFINLPRGGGAGSCSWNLHPCSHQWH